MTRAPTISVLVTVHNRERYLADCLDSILASTWADFDVIIVDDCSTDGSVDIAARYVEADNRVQLHRNDTNLGDYPNRRRAAELATGKYIKYVDSDDLIYPHGLGVMVKAMEQNPHVALGLSHSRPEDEQPYPWVLSPAKSWRKHFLGDGCMSCGPSGAIMRRNAYLETGGFGARGVLTDSAMWYRMSAKWPIALLPPGLVWWRRHENQEYTKEGSGHEYLEGRFKLDMETIASRESPLTRSETESAMRRARQHYARRLLRLSLLSRKPVDALRLFRSSGLELRELASGLLRYR